MCGFTPARGRKRSRATPSARAGSSRATPGVRVGSGRSTSSARAGSSRSSVFSPSTPVDPRDTAPLLTFPSPRSQPQPHLDLASPSHSRSLHLSLSPSLSRVARSRLSGEHTHSFRQCSRPSYNAQGGTACPGPRREAAATHPARPWCSARRRAKAPPAHSTIARCNAQDPSAWSRRDLHAEGWRGNGPAPRDGTRRPRSAPTTARAGARRRGEAAPLGDPLRPGARGHGRHPGRGERASATRERGRWPLAEDRRTNRRNLTPVRRRSGRGRALARRPAARLLPARARLGDRPRARDARWERSPRSRPPRAHERRKRR